MVSSSGVALADFSHPKERQQQKGRGVQFHGWHFFLGGYQERVFVGWVYQSRALLH